jgi:hypothetical protein
MPPPVPPKVKDGRMMAGRPIAGSAATASSSERTSRLLGETRPMRSIASRKSWRSSALAMASSLAPINSTCQRLSAPERASAIAVLSAVCPPMVGSSASGRSFSMMRSTISGVIGSM